MSGRENLKRGGCIPISPPHFCLLKYKVNAENRNYSNNVTPGCANDSVIFPLFFAPLAGIGAQKVRVDEELEAYPTETVDLRCQFIDGGGKTKLTQVGSRRF